MKNKKRYGSPLALVVALCIFVGSIISYVIQKEEKKNYFAPTKPKTTTEDYSDDYSYGQDYWYPSGNISNDYNLEYLSPSEFSKQVSKLLGYDYVTGNVSDLSCTKEVYKRYYEGTNQLLNSEVTYSVDGVIIVSKVTEYRKVYRDRNTGCEYTYLLDEAIPKSIINSCDYIEIRKNSYVRHYFAQNNLDNTLVDNSRTNDKAKVKTLRRNNI